MRLHMLTRPDIEHRQPVVGQIATSGGVIFGNIPRDIGKLKGEAKVAGAVERGVIIRRNPHHDGHHHPHGTRNMIAILV